MSDIRITQDYLTALVEVTGSFGLSDSWITQDYLTALVEVTGSFGLSDSRITQDYLTVLLPISGSSFSGSVSFVPVIEDISSFSAAFYGQLWPKRKRL